MENAKLYCMLENSAQTVKLRTQECPLCKEPMGDMPGSRDAYCSNCGYKDPCCE